MAIDIEACRMDPAAGFFKLREAFGWTETEARSVAWRAACSLDARGFERALAALREIDFRHSPSGATLLGLVLAVESGDDDLEAPMLRALLARGANPNDPIDAAGSLAVVACAGAGREDAALLLLARGADPRLRQSDGVSLSEMARSGSRAAARILEISRSE